MASEAAKGDGSLITYLLEEDLRHRGGGEAYREEQSHCYGRLVRLLAEWGRGEGISRVMLGLSGGLDSAMVAEVAVRAFGAPNVLTVFMPSEYTSEASREDAGALASSLGVEMLTMPIDGLRREAARCVLEAGVGGEEGLWAENVQARLRAVLLMAVSNRRGHVLLNTSNLSEILVGYSTLYGDTCGAVSVLGDLYKSEITVLAQWVNAKAGVPVIPERIISRPPSAELRANQKDEDTLPKYEVLDCILAGMLGEVKGGDSLILGYDEAELARVRNEVAMRVERSAFKRDQLAHRLPVYGRELPKRGTLLERMS